jgi:uncharacterized protein
MLASKLAPPPTAAPLPPPPPEAGAASASGPAKASKAVEPSMLEKVMDSPAFKSAMRSAGTVIGREITRGIFGTGRRR